MTTIAEQLTDLAEVKEAIKNSIIEKGVSVADTDTFRSYADKVAEIQTKKMGMSIGNIIGDVSSNGTYIPPSEPYTLDLTGVKTVDDRGFQYAFYGDKTIDKVIANDVTSVDAYGFAYAFANAPKLSHVSFDGIEEIDDTCSFYYLLYNTLSPEYAYVSFAKLKKITGNFAFSYAFGGRSITSIPTMDEMFPSLEEITGERAFQYAFRPDAGNVITFSKIKKITGGTATTKATITLTSSVRNTIWNFPSAIEFTGYVWNLGASYPAEIHFAAANQAAIEACEGYSYKWGMQGATIFFDL